MTQSHTCTHMPHVLFLPSLSNISTDADLKDLDSFVKAMEILHPGVLIVNGDGMHGIRGKNIDDGNDGPLVSHEDKMEKKLRKSNYVHDPKDKTHGSKAAHNLDKQLHHGKHDVHEKHLSMHERAALAVKDKKAHGKLHLHHDAHHHEHIHHGENFVVVVVCFFCSLFFVRC